MKKLTTGKIWQFAAGQLDGRCCPGLFLTGLYIFISRIRQPSVRDRQYLFHRGWWSLAYLLLLAELQLSEEFLMLLQIQ